jgi:hypothetical protein
LRIAHALGDLSPLRLQRRQIGLRRFHINKPVYQGDPLRVVLREQSRFEVAVASLNSRLALGMVLSQ